jgi:hypothetical protein
MERDAWLQGIFTCTCVLKRLFISKALREQRPSMLPKGGALMETAAHSKAYLTYLLGSPEKGPSLPVPIMGPPRTETQYGLDGITKYKQLKIAQ